MSDLFFMFIYVIIFVYTDKFIYVRLVSIAK